MEGNGSCRQILGRQGEDIACEMLRGIGHVVLERNWRNGHLEIDIISLDADGIHFVEVKTRRDNIQAPPQFSVDRAKQNRIVKAALGYLHSRKGHALSSYECHFDVIAVTFAGEEYSIEWFPQAYTPIYV